MNKYLKNKPRSSYTKEVNNAIKIVSTNFLESIPFGTYIYKGSPFPSDIDVMEVIKVCCTIDETIKEMKNKLQKIVKDISLTTNIYIPEIKTGLDGRFMLIGLGNYKIDKLKDYNSNLVKTQLKILFDKDLLSESEYIELSNLATENITREKWEILYNYLRELWILRWKPEEIIQGFKWLRGNVKKTLNDALKDETPVKIDTWQIINGKYTEVTNFFILIYVNEKGEETFLNLPQNYLSDFKNNLKKEVSKYYFSIKDFKPLKMAKRIWSISRLNGDLKTTNKLTPLLRSDGALVGQVISDISLMIDMLEKLTAPPLNIILPQIDNFKQRLTYSINIPFDEEHAYNIIDNVINTNDNNKRIKLLKELKKYLQKYVNEYVIKYLKKIKLWPPLKYFG